MKIEYAEIIHDIVEKGLDARYLSFCLTVCDLKQVHELVERLKKEEQKYEYISDTAKDSLIKEVTLISQGNEICRIQDEIEEL